MKRASLPVVLTAALLVAGCGEEDGEVSESLSREDYLARGDEICAAGDEAIEEQTEDNFGAVPPREGDEAERFVSEVVLPNIQSQIDQLRDLPPPKGDEESVDAIYAAADEGLADARQDPATIARGETPAGLEEANRLAREYGFQECGDDED
jgi:hypothetical protein